MTECILVAAFCPARAFLPSAEFIVFAINWLFIVFACQNELVASTGHPQFIGGSAWFSSS